MTGAQMVWEAFVREVKLYLTPGGAILPTYDALASYEGGKIHHVLRVMNRRCIWRWLRPPPDGWACASATGLRLPSGHRRQP